MEVSDKVIKKIQNLIEFQNSAKAIGSPEEAANAASKVQDILLRYNLSMADIGEHKEKSKVTRKVYNDITPRKNESTWIFSLYSALCKFNFCKLIVIEDLPVVVGNNVIKKTYAALIGEEENILVVRFLGEQLEARLRDMARERYAELKNHISEKRNTFIRGYLRGAVNGIKTQLKNAQEREMQSNVKVNTLVHVKADKVDKYLQDELGPLQSKTSSPLSSSIGTGIGYRDGKSMSINKGIEGGNNSYEALNN